MKAVFIALMIVHLLLHSLGFIKAFKIVEIPESRHHISKLQGIIWLMTSLLYLPALELYILDDPKWSIIAIITCIISQVLVIMNWSDAKFATIPNLIVLTMAVINLLEWQSVSRYQIDAGQNNGDYPAEYITQREVDNYPVLLNNHLD